MKDGAIKIQFEDGRITGIFSNAQLDFVYERMFNNARRNVKRNPDKLEHCINAIIFGCFLLEASCNKTLRLIVMNESSSSQYGKALWEALKGGNFSNKFKVISSFANDVQLLEYESLLPSVRRVFDLRNRLAHFKDPDIQIARESTLVEMVLLLATVPDPELIEELSKPKIYNHVKVISDGKKWINKIFNKYRSEKGLLVKLPKKSITSKSLSREQQIEFYRKLIQEPDGIDLMIAIAQKYGGIDNYQAVAQVLQEKASKEAIKALEILARKGSDAEKEIVAQALSTIHNKDVSTHTRSSKEG